MTEHVRPPGRLQRTLYAATKRIEGHTMALGLVATAIGLFMAYLAWASISGVPFQDRYEIKALVPSDSPILQEGDAVRIAGRLAGLVTDVDPGPEAGSTEISMDIRPQYAPIGKDADATVRVKSLIYLSYLELDPGNIDEPLEEGETLPLEQGGSNTDLLEVVELFDRESRDALSRSIYNTGVGLADRGGDLNVALADLAEVTVNGGRQLQAITEEPGAIGRVVNGASRVAGGLTGVRADDVAGLLTAGAAVVTTLANRREELGQTIEELRPLEDELLETAPLLDPVLDDATGLGRELDPVVSELAASLPKLNRTLARGDAVREQTARLTAALRPVLRDATPVIAGLQPTVAAVSAMVPSLNQLIRTVAPFAEDITISSEQVLSASSKLYPTTKPAGQENAALRFAPIFACHVARNPDPEPGEPAEQAEEC
jgi:ABC-type transporter Mla subunit MlaD